MSGSSHSRYSQKGDWRGPLRVVGTSPLSSDGGSMGKQDDDSLEKTTPPWWEKITDG